MKKLLYGVVCIAFIGFLSACGGNDKTAPAENQATEEQAEEQTTEEQTTEEETPTANAGEAEASYQQKCSACHGGDLISGSAPDLNAIGSKYSKDEILDIITNGKGNMPPGLLTGADADSVASWLAGKK